MKWMVALYTALAVVSLSLRYLLMGDFGFIGAEIGWIGGQGLTAAIALILLRIERGA